MKFLLVCAMEKEANFFIKYYNLIQVSDNFFANKNISLVITGISRNCVVDSMFRLSRNYNLEDFVVINIGLVGSNNLRIGDIVCIDYSYGYHFDLTPFGDPRYTAFASPYKLDLVSDLNSIKCYTSDGFVTSTDITDTCVFDMELNSIVLFPHKSIFSIKVVSDTLNKDLYNDFNYDLAMEGCLKYVDKIIKDF